MKNKIKILPVLLLFCAGITIAPQKATAQVSVSFQVFYDDLSPYGNWVNYSDYGYVWVPDAGDGFTPYSSNGHWIYTYDGWTWVSDYSWGWAPFHYGRWFYEPYYGWIWVPGNEWGPGWVTWRRSNDYYGWAPIGPGISIDMAYSSGYNLPYDRWTFVRNRDFGRTNINNYYINNSNNVTIINNTTVINNIQLNGNRNTRYNAGPDRTEVERSVGRKFSPIAIRETNKPGQRLQSNQLEIYRPQVQKDNTGSRSTPSRVADIKNMKNQGQRNTENQQRQRNDQQNKQQQQQQQEKQRVDQQNKQQQQQQQEKQRIDQQNKQQQQQQQQRNEQQNKQQQQQRKVEPTKQPPVQSPKNEPARKKESPGKNRE